MIEELEVPIINATSFLKEFYISFINNYARNPVEMARRHKLAVSNAKNLYHLQKALRNLYSEYLINNYKLPSVIIFEDNGIDSSIFFKEMAQEISSRLGLEFTDNSLEQEADKFFFYEAYSPSLMLYGLTDTVTSHTSSLDLLPIPFRGFAGIVFLKSLNRASEQAKLTVFSLMRDRQLYIPNLVISPFTLIIVSWKKGEEPIGYERDVFSSSLRYSFSLSDERNFYQLLSWGCSSTKGGSWNLHPIVFHFLKLLYYLDKSPLLSNYGRLQRVDFTSIMRLSLILYNIIPQGLTVNWIDKGPSFLDDVLELLVKGEKVEKVMVKLKQRVEENRLFLSREAVFSKMTHLLPLAGENKEEFANYIESLST